MPNVIPSVCKINGTAPGASHSATLAQSTPVFYDGKNFNSLMVGVSIEITNTLTNRSASMAFLVAADQPQQVLVALEDRSTFIKGDLSWETGVTPHNAVRFRGALVTPNQIDTRYDGYVVICD